MTRHIRQSGTHNLRRPRAGEPVVEKHRYNSFYATDLAMILRGLGGETVVPTGMTSECCVLGTAAGASERGFRSPVIAAAASARPDRRR
ncbi:cysteine hydrolase family protein [Amycolatopsis rhabdoformis]|uniref:cysteine hydrolase family protein n=1 Tax=Amycolatopsis rhabdoformis TaxID=1448059 RepID=UPI0038993EE2